MSKRDAARVLGISRVAVRKVLRSNSTTVPELQRPEKAGPHRQQILERIESRGQFLPGECHSMLTIVGRPLSKQEAARRVASTAAPEVGESPANPADETRGGPTLSLSGLDNAS